MRLRFAITSVAVVGTIAAVQSYAGLSNWHLGAAIAAQPTAGHLVAAAGLVEPASEARQLDATVVGRLVTLNVDEGDHVTAGQILAEIENADLKAQLAEAEAVLVARQNELTRLLTGVRPQEIDQSRAALREAEASAAEASSNFNRQSALGSKKLTSDTVVEQALASRDTSSAHRALVAAQLSLLTAPPRVEDAGIARANVAAAQARIDEIKADIEKTIVRSPVDGKVLKLYRRKGETVTNLPPTPIVTVGDTSRLRVRADVDQSDIENVAVGQTVWVTADAYRGKRFRGTVVRLGAQLGRKNFRTDDPNERVDTKILDVLIDLDSGARLSIGLPVDVVFDRVIKPTPQLESRGQAHPVRPEQRADRKVSAPSTRIPVVAATDVTPAAWVKESESPSIDVARPVVATPGNAMVQIGSYNSAVLANGAWTQFKANHDQLVSGFDADIREADLGDNGVKYRLRFGPLLYSTAAARCEELKQRGISCLVVKRD